MPYPDGEKSSGPKIPDHLMKYYVSYNSLDKQGYPRFITDLFLKLYNYGESKHWTFFAEVLRNRNEYSQLLSFLLNILSSQREIVMFALDWAIACYKQEMSKHGFIQRSFDSLTINQETVLEDAVEAKELLDKVDKKAQPVLHAKRTEEVEYFKKQLEKLRFYYDIRSVREGVKWAPTIDAIQAVKCYITKGVENWAIIISVMRSGIPNQDGRTWQIEENEPLSQIIDTLIAQIRQQEAKEKANSALPF